MEEDSSGTIPADEIILSSPHGVSWGRKVGGKKCQNSNFWLARLWMWLDAAKRQSHDSLGTSY